jgi:hypothetical protein
MQHSTETHRWQVRVHSTADCAQLAIVTASGHHSTDQGGKMPLNFRDAEPFFDPVEQAVSWHGYDGRRTVLCKVTCSAIDDLYEASELTEEDRWIIFNRHRGIFEAIAYKKYDAHQITEQGAVVVETTDLADFHGKFGEYRRRMPEKFV